ncbi:jg5062 [Pararge aegeria aegeria]|uniref:Jg5062 protein n=1 Tax=Pararge aegeria aegeria TaxID=348720 RepID=A0A8S4R7E9_9NEOP|nr:jg5062 [Pararge aegeria aegeria]
MDSGKALYGLLKAIQFQECAVFCAMSEGLKLTVEEGKCVQASAYVPADNFTEYHVREDVDVMFKPQSVHNVMTDCEISTQTADSVLELRDEDASEVAKLVLKASAFLGLLVDLERSCDVMELNLSPDHPNVSIVTYGMQDRSCIEVPKSSDMMQSFSCEQAVSLKYQLPHIRLIMKALAISSKVVLRCSSNGLLLLQLKLEKDDQRQMFSEFHIVPLLDDY